MARSGVMPDPAGQQQDLARVRVAVNEPYGFLR